MNWEEAMSLWLSAAEAEGCSPVTLKTYREHLVPLTRWLKDNGLKAVAEVNAFHLRRFLSEYGRTRRPRSVLSVYGTLRTCFRWLTAEGILPASPTARMKSPKVPETSKEIYSPGELVSILKYLEKASTALARRDYALVSILADTGARAGEVLSLTVDGLEGDCLLLAQTKGKKPRLVPLGHRAQRVLWAYMQRGRPRLKPKDKRVFLSLQGRAMSFNSLRCLLRRIGQALGFRVSAHRFRHTWTTMMLRKGVDLETLRRMGGWTDYTMLMTYVHLSIDHLREAQQRYSILDGLGKAGGV